ncbi:MAG: archease [candidate division WOR-3 bacterium]|nr:archease [candidate division WOR-3 bacterium]MDW8113712.1 archease [candidate division WOR-3 bacterium]
MRYKLIPHTSDLGVEIYGKTIEELFLNALYCVTDNITDIQKVNEIKEREIGVEGEDLEDLFMNFLRELIFIFSTEYFLAKNMKDLKIEKDYKKLTGILVGEIFDKDKHPIKIELKTPTYHLFSIKKEEIYKATVIFDV